MNHLADAPPNVQAIRLLSPDGHVPADCPVLSPLNLEVTDDPFHCLNSVRQAIKCDHSTLGFEISACHIRKHGYISGIVPSTSAARIQNVRRKYLGSYVSFNDTPVFSCESVLAALTAATASDAASSITFASSIPFGPPRPLPQTQQHRSPRAMTMHEPLPHDQLLLLMRSLNTTAFVTEEEQALWMVLPW
jgi:hypothetical protein